MMTALLILLTVILIAGIVATIHGVFTGNTFVIVWWCFGGCETLFNLLGACLSGIASAATEG